MAKCSTNRRNSLDDVDASLPKRQRKDSSYYQNMFSPQVEELLKPLRVNEAQLERLKFVFEYELSMGLSEHADNRKQSCLCMAPTFVRNLIDGTEQGQYMALDLGGTNFRVLLVTLERGRKCRHIVRNYNIPIELLTGPCEAVFDHLAASIEHFLEEQNMLEAKLPMGFCFSFPMEQIDLTSAKLLIWTKSFKCIGGIGEDVVKHLEDAMIRRRDLKVQIVAILNDTTGTLMAGNYQDPKCQIALILGTGSNVCYVEELDRVPRWEGDRDDPKEVIIDVEWGAFGDNGCLEYIKTDYDKAVDRASNHVGSFTFEKLFSGLYMGEVVRATVVRLVDEGLMFDGIMPEPLSKPFSLPTKHVSLIENDYASDFTETRDLLQSIGIRGHQLDFALLGYICRLVSKRAADVIAAGLSVLVNRLNKPQMTIAVDGSVFKFHPHLKSMLEELIADQCRKTRCSFILADDGSGLGAGFVAAVAMRQRQRLSAKIKQLGWRGMQAHLATS